MKTTFLSFLAICIFSLFAITDVNAQEFQKGDSYFHAGIGLSGGGYTIPPIGVSYEKGISDKIGIGGIASFASWSGGGIDLNLITIGARGQYHHDFEIDKLDTYAGVTLGYSMFTSQQSNYFGNLGGIIYGGHVGARYNFAPSMGAFGEIGYGIAYLTLGISFKM